MRHKSSTPETPSERLRRDIRRATRKQYSAEEKIRTVLRCAFGDDAAAADAETTANATACAWQDASV